RSAARGGILRSCSRRSRPSIEPRSCAAILPPRPVRGLTWGWGRRHRCPNSTGSRLGTPCSAFTSVPSTDRDDPLDTGHLGGPPPPGPPVPAGEGRDQAVGEEEHHPDQY